MNVISLDFPIDHNTTSEKQVMNEELTDDSILRLNGDKLIEAGINALNRLPTQRGKSDINILIRLTEEIQFFKNHFGQQHRTLLSEYSEYFGYQKAAQGQAVFHQGDVGEKFYFILRGKVKVIVSVKRQQIQELHGKRVKTEVNEQVEIKELVSGETFGELALIDQKPRGATILCTENCDFITFEKMSFIKILKDQETSRLREEIKQLNKIYLLKDFSLNLLKNIYLLLTINNYQRGDILFKEGDPSDKLYIIREGEFKISKRFEYNCKDELRMNRLNSNEKNHKVVNLDIGIIGKLQPLGEEEFFLGGKREVTAVCNSKDALVMGINKKDLLRRMSYDQNSIRLMYNRAKEKSAYRETRLQQLRDKYQEDEDTIQLKNYRKNNYKLSHQFNQFSDDIDISQFTQNNSVQLNAHRKGSKANFISPDQNTIRPKSSTAQQVNVNNTTQLQDNHSPKSSRTYDTRIDHKPLFTPSSFGIKQISMLQSDSSPQNIDTNRSKTSKYSNTNNSPSAQSSKQDTNRSILEIKEKQKDEEKSNQSNFTSYLNGIKDTSSPETEQNIGSQIPLPLQNKQNKIFSNNTQDIQKRSLFLQSNSPTSQKGKKIQLKINEKLLEDNKTSSSNCNKEEDEQNSNQGSTINNYLEQNQTLYEVNKNQSFQASRFYHQSQNRNRPYSITEQDSKQNGFLTHILIPESQEKRHDNMVQSQTTIINKGKIINDIHNNLISSYEGEDLYYRGSNISLFNDNRNKISISNSRNDLISSSDVNREQNQLYQNNNNITTQQTIKHSTSQLLSKQKSIIISQDKTRSSILTNKCKNYILHNDNQTILERAKAKSVQKNPFLYLEEFPLSKNVHTNLDEQEVNRLISEKILNQVYKGNQRINLLSQKSSQLMTDRRSSLFFDNSSDNKLFAFNTQPSQSENKQEQNLLSPQLKSVEDNFFAFLNWNNSKNELTEEDRLKQPTLKQDQKNNKQIKRRFSSLTPRGRFFQQCQKSTQMTQSDSNPFGLIKGQQVENRLLISSQSQNQKCKTRPQTAQIIPVLSQTESTNKTQPRSFVSQKVRLLEVPDDLLLGQRGAHSKQLSIQDRNKVKNNNNLDQELTIKLQRMITLDQNSQSISSSVSLRPKTTTITTTTATTASTPTVFKHGFKETPCKQINDQVFHLYNCKDKNDGRCQCSSNHLNLLPLKFRTEIILQNSQAVKKHNFAVRRQGKLYSNVI